VGWLAAVILVGLLLPLGAILYVDILEAKNQVQQEVKKIEKLRRQVEQQQRKEKRNE
jgi:cell division protein FtsB